MKFTLTFVVLCTFAVYSCIAEMEIDLEPTPSAFLGKYENQARDRCNLVNCASMDYTISVASAVFKQAESIYAAAVKVRDLAKPYCTPDYNGYVWVESESLICPTLSTLVSSKPAVRSEMVQTAAAYSSFI